MSEFQATTEPSVRIQCDRISLSTNLSQLLREDDAHPADAIESVLVALLAQDVPPQRLADAAGVAVEAIANRAGDQSDRDQTHQKGEAV